MWHVSIETATWIDSLPWLTQCAYGVKVDEVPMILRTTEEGAVVPGEALPGAVEVVGHHIDEVQVPTNTQTVLFMGKVRVLTHCATFTIHLQLQLCFASPISAVSFLRVDTRMINAYQCIGFCP